MGLSTGERRVTSVRAQRTAWPALQAGCWLVLAAACGGSDDPEANGGRAGAETTGVAGAGAGARAGAGPGGANSSGAGRGGAGHGGAGSGGAGPGGTTGGGVDEVASGSGLSPRLDRYHRAELDRELRFELDVVEGLNPQPASLDYLASFIARAVDKPDGVTFELDETLPAFGSDHVWTFDELDAYSRAHASDDADGPVSIHVLFTDGQYDNGDDSGTVLGLAWGQRYIAMFQDAIRSGCSGGLLGGLQMDMCAIAERNVWAHEIGHVIGLVDNGITQQTPHRDADHGRHDVSDGCLMYWAYERPELFGTLLARVTANEDMDIDFCPNCWADLNAAKDDN